ncbi:MAG: RagB/SusD family nutrient uptake outer membrane protein [Bacteroidota bacterium]
MKKYFFILLMGFGTGLFFSACNDLELQPLDAITEEAFYKTASDFKGAILASYSSMQSLNGTSTENLGECAEWWKVVMMTSDEATFDPAQVGSCATNINMDNLNFIPTDVAFQSIFTHLYQGIFRANLVMDKLAAENELTAEEKALFEAEAKFLRGWFHFQSYRIWGGEAPLALETRRDLTDIALPNSTAEDFVTAMVDDFTAAAAGLPEAWDDANLGRATAWAAKAYLGKMHLYAKDYGAAYNSFKDVYDNGPYQLMPNYADNFAIDQENNMESIFELQYASNSDDNGWVLDDNHSENFKASQGWMRSWWQDAGNGAPGGGLGIYVPTPELIAAYEDGDPRKEETIYSGGETYFGSGGVTADYEEAWSPTGSNFKKYRGVNTTKFVPVNYAIDYNNDRMMRFADVILMYAESMIEGGGGSLSEAAGLINEVRARSFPDGAPVDGSLSQSDMRDALIKERQVELAFEGHRFFDIVRWGIAADVFNAQGKTFQPFGASATFPLPQSEIDRSGGKLTQVR